MRNCVSLDVGKWKQLNIYLFPAPYPESYDIMSMRGLGFVELIRMTFLITPFNLLIWQEGQQLDVLLCNFCGYYVCGCYGLNVIKDNLITPKFLLISCSKRFKSILIGG